MYYKSRIKGVILTILWVAVLILISRIRHPVENVILKIKYESPTTGEARLFWTSNDEEFTYDKYVEETISNGIEMFQLSDSFDGLCLELNNDEDWLIIKSVKLYANGVPYKILQGKKLTNRIKEVVNLKQKEITNNRVTYKSSDQSNRIIFDKTFCKYITKAFNGTFNGFNIVWMSLATVLYIILMQCVKVIPRMNLDKEESENNKNIFVLISILVIGIYGWLYACRKAGVVEYPNWYLLAAYTIFAIGALIIYIFGSDKKIVLSKETYIELFKILTACLDVLTIETATGNLYKVTGVGVLKNIFLIYVLIDIIELIVNRLRIIMHIVNLCCLLFGTVCYYVMQFRGTPFVPWDLKVLSTAVTVAGTYKIRLEISLVCAFLMSILNMLLVGYVRIHNKKSRYIWLVRYLILSLCITEIIRYELPLANLWDVGAVFQQNGSLTSYLSYIRYMNYQVPKGYSKKKCAEVLSDMESIMSDNIEAKNVIIIMNESFADLRVINDKIISNEYTPNLDALQENTIKGNLYVPVFGAGTCNTEFEVLTDVSTTITPSTPYVTAINKKVDSLCWKYQKKGFQTYALHPYLIENWDRDRVYPLLGFQNIYDQRQMDNIDYEGKWISDSSDFTEVINLYEKNKGEPFFIFNVTIQNHGGYDYEYSNKCVDLSQYGEFREAENYLSLLKKSDEAFGDLIEYFKGINEPTVICMFGDHQPALGDEFYELLYGKKLDKIPETEKNKMYITPFVIWANYDIQERYIDKISSNFLGDLILQASGQNLEGFYAFNNNVFQKYPVIFNRGIFDEDGKFYLTDKLGNNIKNELLNQYNELGYYEMHMQ